MDNADFQERVKRLKEVNEVIKSLDPAIREGALPLFAEYVTGYPAAKQPAQKAADENGGKPASNDSGEFFARFPEGKPSDNAVLIAAYVYSQFGGNRSSLTRLGKSQNRSDSRFPPAWT